VKSTRSAGLLGEPGLELFEVLAAQVGDTSHLGVMLRAEDDQLAQGLLGVNDGGWAQTERNLVQVAARRRGQLDGSVGPGPASTGTLVGPVLARQGVDHSGVEERSLQLEQRVGQALPSVLGVDRCERSPKQRACRLHHRLVHPVGRDSVQSTDLGEQVPLARHRVRRESQRRALGNKAGVLVGIVMTGGDAEAWPSGDEVVNGGGCSACHQQPAHKRPTLRRQRLFRLRREHSPLLGAADLANELADALESWLVAAHPRRPQARLIDAGKVLVCGWPSRSGGHPAVPHTSAPMSSSARRYSSANHELDRWRYTLVDSIER